MPRTVLVQVKRQILHFKLRQYFRFVILNAFIGVHLSRRSLDEGGFMVKMASFVR